jgi:hypothetical protein
MFFYSYYVSEIIDVVSICTKADIFTERELSECDYIFNVYVFIPPVVLYGCETWSYFEGGTQTEDF